MARLIPNQNTWVGFITTTATPNVLVASDLTSAVDLTPFLISLNASSRGNTVPTPAFDTLFETSINGTVQASLDADFYRDTTADTAWTTLPRGTTGFLVISRFGGTGTKKKPQATDKVELWPIVVVSRTMANMANNSVMTFSVSCAVPVEPSEALTIGT